MSVVLLYIHEGWSKNVTHQQNLPVSLVPAWKPADGLLEMCLLTLSLTEGQGHEECRGRCRDFVTM